MPQIVESGRNDALGRAAGIAAGVINDQLAKQERQDKEAQRMALADREFELRQQNFGLKKDAFERDFSQNAADTDYYRNLAIENGADPNEIKGMSPEALRNAANTLEHRKQLTDRSQSVRQLADDTFAQLGFTQPTDTSAAPGVQVPGQEQQGQPDPFQQFIENALQNATTIDDLDQVQSLLFKALDTSHQAELDVQQRMQAVETVTPLVQQMSAELPNEIGAKLNTQLSLYRMGHIKMSDLTKSLNDAAKMIDSKNSGSGGITPFTKARLDAIVKDPELSEEQRQQRILELERQAGFGRKSQRPSESVASQIDGADPTKANSSVASERVRGYKTLVSTGVALVSKKKGNTQKVKAAADFVQKTLDRQGIRGPEAAVIAKQMMTALLSGG